MFEVSISPDNFVVASPLWFAQPLNTSKATEIRFIVSKIWILFLIVFPQTAKSQFTKDTLFLKNALKLDLISLYNTFFDARIQVRTGLEYERTTGSKSFLSGYLDLGLYDKYVFKKYYDFFNQNQGMYFIKQNVSVKGFHFIPGYNYFVYQSKRKIHHGLFFGGNMDINFYQKKLEFYNSQTSAKYSQKYNQTKLALGLSMGWKCNFNSHWFIELKTSTFASVYTKISDENMKAIRPLISQWNAPKYNFWWLSNIKICYAFL